MTNMKPIRKRTLNGTDVDGRLSLVRSDALLGSDGLPWPQTFDGQTWAKEFIRHVQERPEIATDEGTMIGWFANAIMVGYDRARQEPNAERQFLARSDNKLDADVGTVNRRMTMDTRTGEIKPWNEIPTEERHHFVPVKRDMTRQERLAKQIGLYSPCACGSGKKFKFCCHVSNAPAEAGKPSRETGRGGAE